MRGFKYYTVILGLINLFSWPVIAAGLSISDSPINVSPAIANNGLRYATIIGWGKPDARTFIMLGINIITIIIFFVGLVLTIYGFSKYLSARRKKDNILTGSANKTIAIGVLLMVIIFGLYALASSTGQEDTADFWREAVKRR